MSLLKELTEKLATFDDETKAQLMAELEASSIGDMLWVPNPGPQTMAYYSPADLLYYGGSAGGGKSQLLLGLAVNEHRVSRLFRRQFKDIDGEGGLAPALSEVLQTTKGYNSQKHVWRVPEDMTGGVRRAVEFGAFESAKDAEAYQGRPADLFGFDEAVQFQYELIRFIIAWNRPAPGVPNDQRCRVVLASNPPVTPEGLWIFDLFAPWLDPEHPNPALPGELRWFATVDGHEIEVDQDYEASIIDASGYELLVKPKSRTFVPASLSDNPDLMDSGYADQLASLPAHLQAALAQGKFTTTLEDAERQVIPTDWILKAQERWMLQKRDLANRPMTSLGIDVASGGQDRMVCAALHTTTFDRWHEKPGAEVKSAGEKFAFVMSVARDDPQFNVDNNGYGDDLCSALESNNFNVKRLKGGRGSSAKARDGREFENKRCEMIWRFREGLDPVNGDRIALPPGREIVMELSSFREQPREDMRKVIRIESNDEIKKRIGRSPDIAWAYLFAWADPDKAGAVDRESYIRKRSGRTPPRIHHQRSNVIGRKK